MPLKECNWQKVVLITKGGGDFVEIRLIELLWKQLADRGYVTVP